MGNFSFKFVEPKRRQNPWEVQQKSSNLYLLLLLKIKLSKTNLFLAVILIYLREHFVPLAKTTVKAFILKGFSGQSCFNSLEVGDVERLEKLKGAED